MSRRRCRHDWDVVEIRSVASTRPINRYLVCARCRTTRPVGATRIEQQDSTEFPYLVWCDECNRLVLAVENLELAEHTRDVHILNTEYHHA